MNLHIRITFEPTGLLRRQICLDWKLICVDSIDSKLIYKHKVLFKHQQHLKALPGRVYSSSLWSSAIGSCAATPPPSTPRTRSGCSAQGLVLHAKRHMLSSAKIRMLATSFVNDPLYILYLIYYNVPFREADIYLHYIFHREFSNKENIHILFINYNVYLMRWPTPGAGPGPAVGTRSACSSPS